MSVSREIDEELKHLEKQATVALQTLNEVHSELLPSKLKAEYRSAVWRLNDLINRSQYVQNARKTGVSPQ